MFRNSYVRLFLVGFAITATIIVGFGFPYAWVISGHALREAIEILWRFTMIAGIITGGAWALYQWFKHRASKPSISVTGMSVESQRVGSGELYVLVDVTFNNTSKVMIDISQRGCYLRRVSPLTPEEIEQVKCGFTRDRSKPLKLPWIDETFGVIERDSEEGTDILEPDEELHEFFEFIVIPRSLYTLAAYFYIDYQSDNSVRCDQYKLHSVTEVNSDGREERRKEETP